MHCLRTRKRRKTESNPVSNLQERLAGLPPEKIRELAKLLKERKQPPEEPRATLPAASSPAAPERSTEYLSLDGSLTGSPAQVRAGYKQFYDGVSAQLNSNLYGEFSYFLNYGYKSNGQLEFAAITLPEQFINRNSVKLVLELIGDCQVEGKRVLDVGCGRGGTIYVFKTFFKPARLNGLDLSSTAIEFCKRAHKDLRVSFQEGDAENLPFESGSMDIVTNVESSHSYPNIFRFYNEVYRVLAPGGHFLYTDTLAVSQMAQCCAYLQQLGFTLLRDRDITANVLLSCDEIASTRVQAFDARNDRALMQNFLATPDSQVYQEMKSGRWTYRILKFQKGAEP
jgi:SAM-dependent methyltransferase